MSPCFSLAVLCIFNVENENKQINSYANPSLHNRIAANIKGTQLKNVATTCGYGLLGNVSTA